MTLVRTRRSCRLTSVKRERTACLVSVIVAASWRGLVRRAHVDEHVVREAAEAVVVRADEVIADVADRRGMGRGRERGRGVRVSRERARCSAGERRRRRACARIEEGVVACALERDFLERLSGFVALRHRERFVGGVRH